MADSIQSLGVAGGFRTTPTFDLGDLKPIDPNARATLGGFAEPTTLDAGGAKLIDLTAREKLPNPGDEFDDAPPEADPGNEFDTVDDLDARTVEDLDKDRDNFDPVSYLSNNPDVAENPARLQKLLDIRRLRDKEGLVASRVVQAAVKDPIGAIKKFGAGVRDFGANVIDTTLQPTVNVLGAIATGDVADPQRRAALFSQTRKDLKKSVAEIDAAAESEALGFVDLSRQGLRKAENPLSRIPDDLPRTRVGTANVAPDKPKTDQDLLQEISDDVAFRKQAAEVLSGEGEAAKAFGLDQTTLAKEGITLDKEAIESISLVGPLTMVASAGTYTLVGAGGKVLATARSLEGVKKVSEGLKKLANNVIGRPIQAVGKATTFAGESVRRTPGLLTAATMGSVMTGQGIPESLVAGIALKGAAEAAKFIGPKIDAAGARIATGGSTAINTLTDLAGKGLKVAEAPALGALATAPLAVMTDDDAAAGAMLQAGAIFGVGAGAAKAGGSAFRAVKTKAARELFGPNRKPMADVSSPDYGRVPELDEMTRVEGAKLTPQNRADLNNFREALRSQGGEIYVVNKETFRSKVADTFAAETGKELTPEALANYERHHAFFDEFSPSGQKIVYLNSDTTGLLHDSGHIFDALLSPEKQTELNAAIDKSFTSEQIAEFQSKYEKAVGNKISADDAKKEYRAELFGALFNNVPVTDLAAPKSLLKSFAGIAAEGAEALGIDLTGGMRTPNLQAGQTVGLRSAFEYAARDVLKQGKEVPPPSAPPTPPLTDGGTPTPPVTPPPAPAPAPAPVAPNIRVTKAQQDAFSHRNAETGVARARELAASDPVVAARVNEISQSLEAGNPVLEIEHLGIVSETPAAGRRTRVSEQEAGYVELERLRVENRAEAPSSIVNTHQKVFIPVRWVEQGGTPTLLAVSLDKTISNIRRVAKEAQGKGVDDLIPYEMAEGKFTEAAWTQIIEDSKSYAENHNNGYRGDGKKLVRPAADVGLSLPAENPGYSPKILSDEISDFMNLLQGLNTPATAREVRGQIPANIKAQVLASANQRTLLEPAAIRPRNVAKQDFASFPGKTVREVNPMRRDLIAKGVDLDKLLPVVERLRAKDIVSAKPRPDLNFRAPVSDLVRGGFLPATEFRRKNLSGRTVDEFSDYIVKLTPGEWKETTDAFQGGLTGGAWSLGLSLTDASHVGVLKSFQEKLSTAAKDAMMSGDFDAAYSLVSKGQFFREAYEAATGTGSAGAAFKRNVMGTEGVKVPFPAEEKPK